MDLDLYKRLTIPAESLLGTEFEAGDNGWCKHCGWARFAHFIRESDKSFRCRKDTYGHSASVSQENK